MKTARSLSWLVVVAGLWEVLAPFTLDYSATTAALGNAVIVGMVLIFLAVSAALSENEGTGRTLGWINAVLGVWLILSPFILDYSVVTAALWNDIIVGAVVIMLATWAVSELGKQIASHA